ncbi:MAG: dephospho-CoA kinase [Deinococcota bacterium]|nr:dephospho-CoA kinase [Deinococcota bacterium]
MRPLRLGLTGNIGSGKSTAARLLVARGAALVDADELAREAAGDPEVLARIAAELGPELVEDGRLDRAATAARVFGDEAARQALNAIVHPWVRRRSDEEVRALLERAPPPVILLDIPLLFENGLERGLDGVIVVAADLPARVARVAARSGLREDEVRARDAAQMPLAEKARRADYLLDNSGSPEALGAQIDALWAELTKRAREDP